MINKPQKIILAIMAPILIVLGFVCAGLIVPLHSECLLTKYDITNPLPTGSTPRLQDIINNHPGIWESLSSSQRKEFADAFFTKQLLQQQRLNLESHSIQTEVLADYYKLYGIHSKPQVSQLKFDENKFCYASKAVPLLATPKEVSNFDQSILLWIAICLTITLFELWLFRRCQ